MYVKISIRVRKLEELKEKILFICLDEKLGESVSKEFADNLSMHFANLKKRTIKIDEDKYRMELEFNRDDETEMVIRLLQFGPVIKVLEPDYIVAEIVKRLSMQLRLIK